VEASVEMWTKDGCVRRRISILEATSAIASTCGFFDIDIDPGPDSVKLTASGTSSKITVKGKTLTEACEKLIGRIL